jgi:uncharacterized protein YndB with AHSA1/START domain
MPTVTRTRTVSASPERVWTVIANPERLVEWWPRVQRVEEADARSWTTVVTAPKGGRALRADYTLVDEQYPHRRAWRHEVAESPFERVLSSSVTEIELTLDGDGSTAVTLSMELGLRGFSRLGGGQIRRATKRTLSGALDGLERVVGPDGDR